MRNVQILYVSNVSSCYRCLNKSVNRVFRFLGREKDLSCDPKFSARNFFKGNNSQTQSLQVKFESSYKSVAVAPKNPKDAEPASGSRSTSKTSSCSSGRHLVGQYFPCNIVSRVRCPFVVS